MTKFNTKVINTEQGCQVEFAIGSQVFHLQEQTKKDLVYTEGLPLCTYSEMFRGHLSSALKGLTQKEQLKIELLKEKPYLFKNHIIVNGVKLDVPINNSVELLDIVLTHLGFTLKIEINED